MISLTNDQYYGLSRLEKWYRKYQHQIIDIAGIIGTGTFQLVQKFIENESFDPREVMYLSYDQKQVLELADKRYHAYYINRIIYNYTRFVDFDSLPVMNPNSNAIEYTWKKNVRKKIDPRYKLMVVFDSVLLNEQTLQDLASFGLPIILIRDPMLLPAPDTYTFLRNPNILLRELHPDFSSNPIVYFAHKILMGERIVPGNYDTVSVVPRKNMNLYNLKSSDMVITTSNELRDEINMIYRNRILKRHDNVNIVGERLIVMEDMYAHRLVNKDEKKLKLYLTKGTVGYITRINRHVKTTKYVPFEFKMEYYYEPFTDLVLDRHYLNRISFDSKQVIPDECIKTEYAYALTPSLARVSHWDKVVMILDNNGDIPLELQTRMLYTGITRAKQSLTLIL